MSKSLGLCTQTLKPSALPVLRPERPVSYASLLLIDCELKRSEKIGVPVSYSKWSAPIMVVKKISDLC